MRLEKLREGGTAVCYKTFTATAVSLYPPPNLPTISLHGHATKKKATRASVLLVPGLLASPPPSPP